MSHEVRIELSDEVYASIVKLAEARGQTLEVWLEKDLHERLGGRDENLRQYFGAVSSGRVDSADNEGIDRDLARAYDDTNEDS